MSLPGDDLQRLICQYAEAISGQLSEVRVLCFQADSSTREIDGGGYGDTIV